MSYEQVPKISSIDMERQAGNVAAMTQQQQSVPVKPPETRAKPVETKTEDPKPEAAKQAPVMTADVSLRFIVDEDTHAITILVVDRANQKVIRSIPPEELGNFQGGSLFDYFA